MVWFHALSRSIPRAAGNSSGSEIHLLQRIARSCLPNCRHATVLSRVFVDASYGCVCLSDRDCFYECVGIVVGGNWLRPSQPYLPGKTHTADVCPIRMLPNCASRPVNAAVGQLTAGIAAVNP